MQQQLSRILSELGAVTLAGWAWRHRATLVRGGELALLHAPAQLVHGRIDELTTEAKAVMALDEDLGDDLNVRIHQVADHTLALRGGIDEETAGTAREALGTVSSIDKVRIAIEAVTLLASPA
jgi:hypothetical protein